MMLWEVAGDLDQPDRLSTLRPSGLGRELVESFSPTDAEVSWARVGSALENAAAEAFNSTIKVEYIHRNRFATRHEARLKISTWIVDFYNLRRRHSACDRMSPIDYERFMVEARMAQAV
ncbi:integrase core domain-containing protein [Streptosporangium sp. H16]|uniref:integrase core domain-containing protein n=1 Tax=Streptosporangium sp. H16 TaxID=3444184 RepID=UPI003F7A8800